MDATLIHTLIQRNPVLATELGEKLYEKITQVVIPEWKAAFDALTKEDCIDYIYNLTINRTFDGYIREKCVINDNLAKIFPDIEFEESPPELDHSGDVDYIGWLNDDVAFGLQIKPITSKSNFGNFKPSERMQANFNTFQQEYGGKVFIVYSVKEEIANKTVIDEIKAEIAKFKQP